MMLEIATLSGKIEIMDNEMKVCGIRSPILYQCPECKDVAVQ